MTANSDIQFYNRGCRDGVDRLCDFHSDCIQDLSVMASARMESTVDYIAQLSKEQWALVEQALEHCENDPYFMPEKRDAFLKVDVEIGVQLIEQGLEES